MRHDNSNASPADNVGTMRQLQCDVVDSWTHTVAMLKEKQGVMQVQLVHAW